MTKTKEEYIADIDKPFSGQLDNIMWEQDSFLSKFIKHGIATDEEKIAYSKEYILSAMREMSEVLNELPWKLHRPQDKEIDVDALHEEIVDVLKFVLNIGILWGMDAQKLHDMFMYKSAVVRERFNKEQSLLNNAQEHGPSTT